MPSIKTRGSSKPTYRPTNITIINQIFSRPGNSSKLTLPTKWCRQLQSMQRFHLSKKRVDNWEIILYDIVIRPIWKIKAL
jgi:hypothetical protein